MTRLLYILTLPLRIWHRYGFDIQSPWAYELVRDVLFEKLPYYAYDKLQIVRENFPKDGYKYSQKADERLFRIANYFAPANIIEIGSKLSACYLAAPHKGTPCYMIEDTADSSGLKILKEHLEEVGTVGLLHIAGSNVTEEIYDTAVNYTASNSVFIIENIHNKRRHLWQTIVRNDSRATVTFDFGSCGMVTFDPKRVKQNYLL